MATKIQLQDKAKRLARRRFSIQAKVRGTAERPRLVVFRSNADIYAQLVDDANGFTLASVGSIKIADKLKKGEKSSVVGKQIAILARDKGIMICRFLMLRLQIWPLLLVVMEQVGLWGRILVVL